MSSAFAQWQPQYAAHNVATFPVTADKVPAVKGYLRVGLQASGQLSIKFPDNDAFGFACKRSKITILDVDTSDERVLADGLARHGPTPFIVRSGSGNFQAYYRHGGENRRVRPDPDRPIDILGDGFVVAPPSKGRKGQYQIIEGTLDDLDRLPRMKHPEAIKAVQSPSADEPIAPKVGASANGHAGVEDIKRNDTLWRHCMKAARSCGTLERLMSAAVEFNKGEFYRPLPADEVLKIVASAWGYEVEGKNRFGYGPRLVMDADVVDELAASNPRAFALLSILQRHHDGCDDFVLAKGMAEKLKWSVNTMKDARDELERRGLIECLHRGGLRPNDPPVYRISKGVRK